jgi:hypothetical protein
VEVRVLVAVRLGVGVRGAKRPAIGSPAAHAPTSIAAKDATHHAVNGVTIRRFPTLPTAHLRSTAL